MDSVALMGLAIFGWLLPAFFVVPFVSRARGYGWFSWIIAALVCSPLLILLALAALPDRRERRTLARIDRRLARWEERQESPGPTAADRFFQRRSSP